MLRELAYVDGQLDGGRRRPDVSRSPIRRPATAIAWVAALDAGQTTAAIDAAAQRLPGWRDLLPQERAANLRNWFELILAAKEDLALMMTLEQGKPLAESRGEIDYAASFVEWYAEEAKRLNAESVTSHLPGAEMIVRREPLGVVGVVTPWNFPSAMLTRKAAAALGGRLHDRRASIVRDAAVGAGAGRTRRARRSAGRRVQHRHRRRRDDRRAALRRCARPRAELHRSTEIGRLIAAQCAPTMKRLVMELGGHAPLIVFADADLERAVRDRHRREIRDVRPGLPRRQPHLCRSAASTTSFCDAFAERDRRR